MFKFLRFLMPCNPGEESFKVLIALLSSERITPFSKRLSNDKLWRIDTNFVIEDKNPIRQLFNEGLNLIASW